MTGPPGSLASECLDKVKKVFDCKSLNGTSFRRIAKKAVKKSYAPGAFSSDFLPGRSFFDQKGGESLNIDGFRDFANRRAIIDGSRGALAHGWIRKFAFVAWRRLKIPRHHLNLDSRPIRLHRSIIIWFLVRRTASCGFGLMSRNVFGHFLAALPVKTA